VARKRDQDTKAVIVEEQEHMGNVEKERSTTTTPDLTCEKMLDAFGGNLNNLASSKDEEDGEDKHYDEDDTGLGKLSEDDEPGWVTGTMTTTFKHRMESLRQK
jgi:hypothetical protein